MRDVNCDDQGCKLEKPYQVGGGVENNVAYLSASSNGLQPQSGSLLIPLSAARGATSIRRRRKRQIEGIRIRRQFGGGRNTKRVSQVGGKRLKQVGGRKVKIVRRRKQVGGSKLKSSKRPIKLRKLQTGGRRYQKATHKRKSRK